MGNYQRWYAIKKTTEARIKKLVPNMENKAGIYVWYRPICKFYAGQSVSLVDRSVAHLMQYDHLGLSIKKHGLYDPIKNPKGWKLIFTYCDKSELNEKERETIAEWSKDNLPYNITSGGQDAGKYDINERKAGKNYTDGVAYGKTVALREVKEFFDKYLNYSIKPELVKKNGEFTETAKRKFNEFGEMLNGETENAESENDNMQ